ncbi:MAG: hypothetical protein PHI98_16610 [Eubacteriales bacterium]|nr:hypothetical protein [Eubacteriales bacterium]
MTLKQLTAEIKRMANYLEEAKKNDKEMLELRGFSTYGKEVDYYTKRLHTLRGALPEAERVEEEKVLAKISKQQLKDKASTIQYIQKGNDLYGITPSGKKWIAVHNWYGSTERTLHCYALHIDGETIFTSGTIDTVLVNVAQN